MKKLTKITTLAECKVFKNLSVHTLDGYKIHLNDKLIFECDNNKEDELLKKLNELLKAGELEYYKNTTDIYDEKREEETVVIDLDKVARFFSFEPKTGLIDWNDEFYDTECKYSISRNCKGYVIKRVITDEDGDKITKTSKILRHHNTSWWDIFEAFENNEYRWFYDQGHSIKYNYFRNRVIMGDFK